MSFIRKSAAVLTVAGMAAGGLAYKTFTENEVPSFLLSPVEELPQEIPQGGGETLICAADTSSCTRETALGVLAGRAQVQVSLAEISDFAEQAVIDAEDRRFRSHNGVDVKGAGRALIHNLTAGAFQQGASTIDRQLAGTIYPKATDEQLNKQDVVTDWVAKQSPAVAQQIYEGRVALKMNEVYTKDQILEKYLNSVYFGRGAWGIEAASQAYFGVKAAELDKLQSMVLASTLTEPSNVDGLIDNDFDPLKDQKLDAEAAERKTNYRRVVSNMLGEGHLSPEEAALFREADVTLRPYIGLAKRGLKNAEAIGATHFIDYAKAEATELLGIDSSELKTGYTIYTTLITKNQAAMNGAIKNEPVIAGNELDAAGVSVHKDGAIIAMVGGKDYGKSEVNTATGTAGGGGGRDSGSSNKGYAAAFAVEHGWSPARLLNVPASIIVPGADNGKDWEVNTGQHCKEANKPVASDGSCQMTLEEGIAVSSNIVAAMIVKEFGIEPIAKKMQDLGVDISEPFNASLILGSGQASPLGEATGYNSLLLNDGKAVPNFSILKIIDNSGKTVHEHAAEATRQVFSAKASKAAAKIMNSVITKGTAKGAVRTSQGIGSLAGKTGTATNNTDLWFTGARCDPNSGGETTSMWIGNPNGNTRIEGASSYTTAKMWGRYIGNIAQNAADCRIAE